MDKFKVGDRVKFINRLASERDPRFYPPVGTTGTIVRVDGDGFPKVKWDDKPDHNRVKFPTDTFLALVPGSNKILIMVDKKDPLKVIARDVGTNKTGEAHCHPGDEFDFFIGAVIALGRLFGHEPELNFDAKPVAPPCKFKVGDKIIGNANAKRYGITREGWIGEVIEILDPPNEGCGCDEGIKRTFKARSVDGADGPWLLAEDAFDLYEEPEEETVIHCNLEENARIIAMIMDFDAEGKVFDWYEQHIRHLSDWYEQQLRAHSEAELEEPKYLTGKLVCTYSDYGIWTVGKVYPVVDGTIYDNKGAPRFKVESADQLTRRLSDPEGGEVRFVDLEPEEDRVHKSTKLEGKLVCTRSDVSWWTEGRIYEAFNGVLIDNDGDATASYSTLEACNSVTVHGQFAFLKE